MKKGIHPELKKTKVVCACGAEYELTTVKEGLRVEVCSNCHPFYTGQATKRAARGGRIERFNKKYGFDA
ncbi:50S ribosomal protein L31 [Anoxybacter fermentans]|uniref:Large ribosomal subunit protein bL31 n=1 Tax=Anoxybacter fermentans TaxID=1323375 RepID=A0A3Q9HRV9_9FIRM|nr:50S ribosomal protein L31 [Anoxybacter fermentans]AZR74018.1 50S ribosomal protein L31 [Anoxybacter fermentans]